MLPTANKKVIYGKQIARQHLCHNNFWPGFGVRSNTKNFPFVMHHHAKFDCCVSCHVDVCKRSQKFGGAPYWVPCDRDHAWLCWNMPFPTCVTIPYLVALGQTAWALIGLIVKFTLRMRATTWLVGSGYIQNHVFGIAHPFPVNNIHIGLYDDD